MFERLVIVAAIVAFGSVHAEETARAQLSLNRAKWEELKIADYRYTWWQRYGNGHQPSPVRVTVRDGKVFSARYLRYAFRPGTELEFVISESEEADASLRRTIPSIFDVASQLLEQYGGYFEITFDEARGFPVAMSGDAPEVNDDELQFRVTDFETLK